VNYKIIPAAIKEGFPWKRCSAVLNNGERCRSGGRFQRCWSGGLKALWVAVGGCGWLKNNHSRLRRSICYSFFFTDCRNRRSLIFTDSIRRKFKIKIYDSYGLHKP